VWWRIARGQFTKNVNAYAAGKFALDRYVTDRRSVLKAHSREAEPALFLNYAGRRLSASIDKLVRAYLGEAESMDTGPHILNAAASRYSAVRRNSSPSNTRKSLPVGR
jgi:site-specific recombinase XerD